MQPTIGTTRGNEAALALVPIAGTFRRVEQPRRAIDCTMPAIPPGKIDPALLIIGIYKFVKVALLIAFAMGARHILRNHRTMVDAAHDLIDQFKLDPDNRFLKWVLEKLAGVSEGTLRTLRLGSIVYAALFAIEGTGLLLRWRWAEWMVIVTTCGLLPVEGYELYLKVDWLRVSAVVVNVAVVVFLVQRIRHPRGEKKLQVA